MKKLYEKNELNFALIWIGVYVVFFSVADSVSASIGIEKLVTTPLCILMTAILYLWIAKNGLKMKYGLCKPEGEMKNYLFYIPLILIASTNIWFGFKMNFSMVEIFLGIVSMLCVGFLEEVIFRGFLFKALCKDNVKRAVIISSVTFGIGHIVNLLNGREAPETLMQICYAVAIGFLFTIIFHKGKSLWPCIITHSVVNSLSIVANADARTFGINIFISAFLCVVSFAYAIYIINRSDNSNNKKETLI